jgi:Nuclease-related domain
VRVVELSNHPGDMLADASQHRAAAGRRAQAGYEDQLLQYRTWLQSLRVSRDRARAQRAWWTWLRLSLSTWWRRRRVPRPPVLAGAPTDLEAKLRAGIAGEELVASELGDVLGDEWTLVRGYRNRRGEIDQLLLGPPGLFAIEIKNLNATVHVDGDRWRADKYDKYDNLVEQRVIADRKGRSPSVQLNEPADALERFLHARSQPVAIQRLVVLTHHRSRLGSCRNLTVRLGVSPGFVLAVAGEPDGRLNARQCADIVRLIRHDHEFNAKARRTSPQPPH